MLISFTVGLFNIAIVMFIMGLAGLPGNILFDVGRKKENNFLVIIGFIITAISQSFVVGAYTVFVVALLRFFSILNPDVPTWPLWIAVFFHSGAVPTYAMKEQPDEPTAAHYSLPIVSSLSLVIFIIMIIAPSILQYLYGWVPYFGNTLK